MTLDHESLALVVEVYDVVGAFKVRSAEKHARLIFSNIAYRMAFKIVFTFNFNVIFVSFFD